MEFYTSVNRKSNKILYRGIKDGKDVYETVYYKPRLYTRCMGEKATHRDFYDGPVHERQFDSIYDMLQFIKNYGDIPNEIWGNKNPIPQFIYEKFGPEIAYNTKQINGAFLDIEVLTRQNVDGVWVDGGFPVASEARFPVNAICQYATNDRKYHVFSLAKWTAENSCYPELAAMTDYHFFDREQELLRAWIQFWKNNYPHYLTGWNVEKFDIPYLVNRIGIQLGEVAATKLSPWNDVMQHEINTKYGVEQTYELTGISTLDYMDLYKKHTFVTRESYTLDHIAEVELNEHKKEFTGTHGSFYWDNPQGFQDYNIKDVNLVVNLDNKLQLLDLVFSLAYFAGINFTETFSPIRTWDTLIYRECMNRGIAVPCSDKKKAREEYEGAYVFPTKNGMYKAIASFDATSLYPSVNRSWNIGADTIVNEPRRSELINLIIAACVRNGNQELAELAQAERPFIEYYRDNGMPDYVTKILQDNKVSLTLNWQFFRVDKESITTYLQSKLFTERKSDKKKSQQFAQREKEIHQELIRRGLVHE